MKKGLKIALTSCGLLFVVMVMSGCTASFCSVTDKSRMLYAFDTGVTLYKDEQATTKAVSFETTDGTVTLNNVTFDFIPLDDNLSLKTTNYKAADSGILVPTELFWREIDKYTIATAWEAYQKNPLDENGVVNENYKALDPTTVTSEQLQKLVLKNYGPLKFAGTTYKEEKDNNGNLVPVDTLWHTWDKWTAILVNRLPEGVAPNLQYINLYKSIMNGYISTYRSCIAMVEYPKGFGEYGHAGHQTPIRITEKSWAEAWGVGFIEGLLVYPVAYMVDFFSQAFNMGGWGQVGAILLVTFIVRVILLLLTFKATSSQTKMQRLQPELTKIQNKYPNANTNQAEKQRMSQEQMALYKKNKVSVFAPILAMIIQFPIFIAVWGAMTGAAVLSTDSLLGLNLSASIGAALGNFNNWPNPGWWTAVVLFILMAASQFVSMKLPNWIQKRKTKGVAKLSKNPAAKKQGSKMKWFSNIMLVVIIIMGLTLPAAMAVYWFAGAIISIIQSVLIEVFSNLYEKHKRKGGKVRTINKKRGR